MLVRQPHSREYMDFERFLSEIRLFTDRQPASQTRTTHPLTSETARQRDSETAHPRDRLPVDSSINHRKRWDKKTCLRFEAGYSNY